MYENGRVKTIQNGITETKQNIICLRCVQFALQSGAHNNVFTRVFHTRSVYNVVISAYLILMSRIINYIIHTVNAQMHIGNI